MDMTPSMLTPTHLLNGGCLAYPALLSARERGGGLLKSCCPLPALPRTYRPSACLVARSSIGHRPSAFVA